MTDFTDLVAVVTGGSSGIGAATASLLVQRVAKIAVLDRDIQQRGAQRTLALRCDVRDSGAVDVVVRAVAEELGGIDVLVNNAGIGAVGDITANDDDEWHRVFDVNVVGIVRVTRADRRPSPA
jgi:NAD(P)-dependent dehydrogenase (short-subunit alcohol dehydrogenase family)